MAITVTVKKGSGNSNFDPGWKKVTSNKATYGTLDNGAKYIDVWFDGHVGAWCGDAVDSW